METRDNELTGSSLLNIPGKDRVFEALITCTHYYSQISRRSDFEPNGSCKIQRGSVCPLKERVMPLASSDADLLEYPDVCSELHTTYACMSLAAVLRRSEP